MGDIGGAAQAGANVADTSMNDATQLAVAGMTDATQLGMQQIANRFNAEQAGESRAFAASQANQANQFSAQQAALNRNFQMGSQVQAEQFSQNMSDTQMQRRVQDLKAAGLNPALSMGPLGGASSPTAGPLPGSSAQGVAMGAPSASAAGVPQLGATSQALNSINQRNLQAQLVRAQSRQLNASAAGQEAANPYAGAQAKATLDRTNQDINTMVAQANALGSQFDINEQNVRNLEQDRSFRAQMQPLLFEAQRLDNQAKNYGLAEGAARAAVMNSPLGRYLIAGGYGHAAGGDIGGAAAMAAYKLYQAGQFPRKSAGGVSISDPTQGLPDYSLEESGIGGPSP